MTRKQWNIYAGSFTSEWRQLPLVDGELCASLLDIILGNSAPEYKTLM
jgi:hypothetical protein